MKIPKPIGDRRRAFRLNCELPFRIGHQGYESEVVSINLSYTGAYVKVSEDIPMMSKLAISISLPTQKKIIRVKGVVVRKIKDDNSGAYFIAVFFSDIKPADQDKLKKFIQSRAKP